MNSSISIHTPTPHRNPPGRIAEIYVLSQNPKKRREGGKNPPHQRKPEPHTYLQLSFQTYARIENSLEQNPIPNPYVQPMNTKRIFSATVEFPHSPSHVCFFIPTQKSTPLPAVTALSPLDPVEFLPPSIDPARSSSRCSSARGTDNPDF